MLAGRESSLVYYGSMVEVLDRMIGSGGQPFCVDVGQKPAVKHQQLAKGPSDSIDSAPSFRCNIHCRFQKSMPEAAGGLGGGILLSWQIQQKIQP